MRRRIHTETGPPAANPFWRPRSERAGLSRSRIDWPPPCVECGASAHWQRRRPTGEIVAVCWAHRDSIPTVDDATEDFPRRRP